VSGHRFGVHVFVQTAVFYAESRGNKKMREKNLKMKKSKKNSEKKVKNRE